VKSPKLDGIGPFLIRFANIFGVFDVLIPIESKFATLLSLYVTGEFGFVAGVEDSLCLCVNNSLVVAFLAK